MALEVTLFFSCQGVGTAAPPSHHLHGYHDDGCGDHDDHHAYDPFCDVHVHGKRGLSLS